MLKKLAIGFGILVAIIIVVSWVIIVLLEGRAEEELENARQKLRAMGAPMTIEEITLPPIPDEQNAAPLFIEAAEYKANASREFSEAVELIQSGPIDEKDFILREQDADTLDLVRKAFKQEEVVTYLNFYEEASMRPEYRKDMSGYNELSPSTFSTPEVSSAMSAASLLSKRSELRFLDNDREGGLSDLGMTVQLVKHMEKDKFIIPQVASVGVVALVVIDRIVEIDRYNGLTTEELISLKEIMGSFSFDGNIISAFDMERIYFADPNFNLVKNSNAEKGYFYEAGNGSFQMQFSDSLFRWYFIRDHAFYLNWQAELRQLHSLPYWDASLKSVALDKKWETRLDEGDYILSQIHLLPSHRIWKTMEKTNSLLSLTRLGLSLSIYYNKNKEYPEKLDALVPNYLDALPIDPLTGDGFIYRRKGEGYMLYSIGLNGIDDGGTTNENGSADERSGDIVWKGRGSIFTDGSGE